MIRAASFGLKYGVSVSPLSALTGDLSRPQAIRNQGVASLFDSRSVRASHVMMSWTIEERT
jgi:hypothetical protein